MSLVWELWISPSRYPGLQRIRLFIPPADPGARRGIHDRVNVSTRARPKAPSGIPRCWDPIRSSLQAKSASRSSDREKLHNASKSPAGRYPSSWISSSAYIHP
jgi:hypothetical protein